MNKVPIPPPPSLLYHEREKWSEMNFQIPKISIRIVFWALLLSNLKRMHCVNVSVASVIFSVIVLASQLCCFPQELDFNVNLFYSFIWLINTLLDSKRSGSVIRFLFVIVSFLNLTLVIKTVFFFFHFRLCKNISFHHFFKSL